MKFMAQFKRDQKICFISPLTDIHDNSRLRFHVPETEGRDFATLLAPFICYVCY